MKRLRTDRVRRNRNKSRLSRMRSAIRKVAEAEGDDEKQAAYREAQSLIDSAGRSNLIIAPLAIDGELVSTLVCRGTTALAAESVLETIEAGQT